MALGVFAERVASRGVWVGSWVVGTAALLVVCAQALAAPTPGDMRVIVDLSDADGETNPLAGTNRGVLETDRNCGSVANAFDYTALYQAIGVTSVRLHDDSFDTSLIFTASELQDGCTCDDLTTNPDCANYTCSDAADGCYTPTSITTDWMQWELWSSTTTDLSLYDFSEADIAYEALLESGIEPYMRLGESWDNATYVHPNTNIPYARAAATIAAHFHDRTNFPDLPAALWQTPTFIELWNEPDGRFWTGPHFAADAGGASTTAHGDRVSEFAALHRRLKFWVESELGSSELVGGPAFTQEGMADFAAPGDVDSFVRLTLSDAQVGEEYFNFLSLHYYGNWWPDAGGFDPNDPAYRTFPSDFVGYMVDSRVALNAFCTDSTDGWGLDASECPPLHLTEWATTLPGNCTKTVGKSTDNLCNSEVGAAYVSSVLSWLQAPSLNVERAHYYARAGLYGGTVSDIGASFGVDLPDASACNYGTTATAASDTYVRVSRQSIATSMHSDLGDKDYVPATLMRYGAGAWLTQDMLGAALQDWPITAYAVTEGNKTPHTIVLTHYFDSAVTVPVEIKGLAMLSPTSITISTLSTSYPDEGCYVDANTDADGDGFLEVDDPAQVAALWIDAVSEVTTATTSTFLGAVTVDVPVPAYGVVRVDIEQP